MKHKPRFQMFLPCFLSALIAFAGRDSDAAFITHEHGDHFERETSAILNTNSHCLFLMPAGCLEAARELNIPESRIKIAEPRKPFDLGAVRVEPVRAIHGGPRFAVFVDANLQDCGYVVCGTDQ